MDVLHGVVQRGFHRILFEVHATPP
jgi:hypothetical protein